MHLSINQLITELIKPTNQPMNQSLNRTILPSLPRLNFCHWCSPFDEYDVLRRFVANCTKTHDTVTRCVSPDYYYTYDRDGGHCQKCTNCTEKGQHFGRNCSETTDAVCCEKDDMVIVNDTCASLPVYCGPIDILDLRPLGDVAKTVLCEDALKSFESRYCRASCESETNPGGNGGKTDSACNCSTTGSVDHTSSSNGLSGGAIAGIVVGVLGAFIVGVILGYFVRGRNCCRKRQRDPPTVDDPEEESQSIVGSNGEQTSV